MIRPQLATVVGLFCVLAGVSSASGAPSPLMTLADLRKEAGIADPRFSPDGKSIVFIDSRGDFDANITVTDLMSVDIRTKAVRALTHGRTGLSEERYSPDGSQLAFIADAVGEDGSTTSQLYVMPTTGGDARQVTHAPEGVQSYAWRPDGHAFAYVTPDSPAPSSGAALDAFVVGDNDYLATEAPEPWHLWTISSQGGTAHRLTRGPKGLPPGEVILPQSVPSDWFSWSRDGKTIAFTQMPNPYKTDGVATDIELVNVATGALRKLTAHGGEEAGGQYSPDGTRLMYWYPKDGNPIAINDLFITSASGGSGKDVTYSLDRNAIGATWMNDSRSLLVWAHDKTWGRFWIVGENGAVQPVDTGQINPGSVPSSDPAMSVRSDGAIAFAGSEPDRPTELYWMANAKAMPERLTDLNAYFQSFALGRVGHIDWTGPGGYPEDGVLTYPPGFDAAKKYPLVLQIHGGPNWASLEAFDTDYEGLSQLFAAHGYVVFEPNYRGSDSFGNAYQLAIFNDAGQGPGEDVMAGVAAVEKFGFVDPSRVAVTGWSYGGYMTTWLIGHYHQWKCAVAGAAPTDDYVDYAISDYNVIGKYYFKGSPWASAAIRQDYIDQSPITYADQVTTPTLILHDTGDVRVPIVEDYEFFHALRDHHVPVEFVAYPVAGHYPGDPIRGEDIYRRWLGWLDQYLK
jgi:dipeptidyl aminopeptidase/acylaminoacyl peptidase